MQRISQTFACMSAVQDKLVYGRHPVMEALQSTRQVEKVLLQSGVRGDFEKTIRQLCKEHLVPLQVVPKERLNSLVKGNHQGVLAWLAVIDYQLLEDIVPQLFEQGKTPLLLVLDGVSDVRNFGAIARSAEVCDAHALVVSKKGGASINADAVKTSAGALNRIPVCRERSILAAVTWLKDAGVRVLASHLEGEKLLPQCDLKGPIAFVLGAEDKGISPEVAQEADEVFQIPQLGRGNSFNVSVAAGIILYEAIRQRHF